MAAKGVPRCPISCGYIFCFLCFAGRGSCLEESKRGIVEGKEEVDIEYGFGRGSVSAWRAAWQQV